jgi:hypothetical protein
MSSGDMKEPATSTSTMEITKARLPETYKFALYLVPEDVSKFYPCNLYSGLQTDADKITKLLDSN